MQPTELFGFCPRCGAVRPDQNRGKSPLSCGACGLVLYFNPTVAGAALIVDHEGRVLFIRRAKDPSAGKLGVLRFLISFPNYYFYREVTYPVVDLYFTAVAVNPRVARPLDAVTAVEWRDPYRVPDEEIAFPSLRVAIAALNPV